MKEKIILASDHAGFELKEVIKKWLTEQGYKIKDVGCFSKESCDYPDYAEKGAIEVANGKNNLGFFFCGTGIGMCIAANKIKGIRAALIHNESTGKAAREHNNANVVCIGARIISIEEAKKAIYAFLNSKFLGERHERRVAKIEAIEEKTML
ncbi:MAG: ribose 5-phosphate isomerase B [Candidatus Diapherotrites archaeon]|nr:ribose 5-phosphate isomerase B [Candidatus Diapherotrites archaeon]